MQSGESMNLLNRVSSQMITRKTLDFLITLAKGEDISLHLKPAEPDQDQEQGDQIETDQDQAGDEGEDKPDPEPRDNAEEQLEDQE